MADDPKAQGKEQQKPPRRQWHATYPRVNLSQGISIALTIALVFVGGTQVVVYLNQAWIMSEQLGEMKTDSAIRRTEIAGKMRYYIDYTSEGNQWSATTRWVNIGKTDASDFWRWDDSIFSILHKK